MRKITLLVLPWLLLHAHAPAQQMAAGLAAAAGLLEAHKWNEALEVLLPLQTAPAWPGQLHDLANMLGYVGEHLQDASAFADALRALEAAEATDLRRSGGEDDPDVAICMGNVAYCLQTLGRLDAAATRYRATLAMWQRLPGDHDADVVTALNNLANCEVALGRTARALPLLEDALATRLRLHGTADHDDVALSRNNLGLCQLQIGRAGEALVHFDTALEMRRRLLDAADPRLANSLDNKAACLHHLGRLREALPLQEEALAIRRRCAGDSDHPDVAVSMSNLAENMVAMGQWDLALPQHEAALAMRRRLYGDVPHPEVATSLNNMAHCLQVLGQMDAALQVFEESLAMRRQLYRDEVHPELAASANNIANCLQELGRPQEALHQFEAALAMLRQLHPARPHPEVVITQNNLGLCLSALDRPADALREFEAALAMQRELVDGDHPSIAGCLNNIAWCRAALGAADQGLAGFQASLAMRRRLVGDRDHPLIARDLGNVAAALHASGEPDRARAALEAACDMIERLRAGSRTSADLRQSHFDLLKRGSPFERLQLVHVDAGRVAAALHAAERARGRELLDLLEQGRFDPLAAATQLAQQRGDAAAVAKLQSLHAELERTALESDRALHQIAHLGDHDLGGERERRRRELVAASERAGQRQRELLGARARLVADVVPAGRVRQAAEIAAALQEGEVFLEYTVTRVMSLVYVVTRDGEPEVFRLPRAGAGLDDRVRRFLTTVARRADPRGHTPGAGRGAGADADTAARELFDSLVPAALWPRLQSARRVLVAAHQVLHRLPFEALVTTVADGKPVYWIDRGPPIAYVPSGSALCWLRDRGAPHATGERVDLLAVGDPRVGRAEPAAASARPAAEPRDAAQVERRHEIDRLSQLRPLRGARAEANEIADLFLARGKKAERCIDIAATETAVFERAAAADYLHFACHGIAERYAGRQLSLLVLSQPEAVSATDDGLLQLDDLLQRWRGRLNGCRLVVLSACDTNVGQSHRDEAPQALPLGFLFAGASAVVCSLWAVDDTSTRETMTDFYARLLAGDGDRLQALTAAKLALRQRQPDPYYWAPFLYLGSPQ